MEFFAPAGPLARRHPRYEPRPGQARMAEAVAAVLRDGGHLMVEAGTGTGKTLAYLVPALQCGRRVIVSTGTRNLQDQIVAREIPFLRDGLGMRVSATHVKGRENYLCRLRLAEMQRAPLFESLDERDWLPRIASWAGETATGDRAEIAAMPDALRLWRDLDARAETCLGAACPEHDVCWLTLRRREAEASQLVIVNHHLFFADLALRSQGASVLPDCDTVILDEAHLVEQVATQALGVQVSSGSLEELARQAEALAARSGGAAKGGGGAALLRQSARELFAPLAELLARSPGRIPFLPADRGGADLEAEWAVLSEALDQIGPQLAAARVSAEAMEPLSRRAEATRIALAQVLARDDEDHVYGLEARGRSIVLSASPVDVSSLLRRELFDTLHASVLTSATLTVGGSFRYVASRLGLDESAGLLVETSFDPERQAVLYLPHEMPDPREAAFLPAALDTIRRLLEITGGRAFLLFTSHGALQRFRAELARDARWPLFVQGEGSRQALLDAFAASGSGVLLGTSSFWHGVDVPGEALSLVIVDRLPFDVPADPLVAARIEHVRRRGGEPFRELQLPAAVLELKQGLGRLLRSRTDRGILAVLDPRITGRRYGSVFLRSLPPYRVVRTLEECRAFFADAA